MLFEAGIAATNLNWFHIQGAVARFAGTASYDRAGLGWSSPCRTARTPANIAAELLRLLTAAGIKPPYMLVGHSFGGLVMRRFALLIRRSSERGAGRSHALRRVAARSIPASKPQVDRGKRLSRYAIPIARVGLARLAVTSFFCRTGRLSGSWPGAAGAGGRHVLEACDTRGRQRCRGKCGRWWPRSGPAPRFTPECAVTCGGARTVERCSAAEPIRDIPVLVLTPGKASPLSDECLRPHRRQRAAVDRASQRALDSPRPTRSGDRFDPRDGDSSNRRARRRRRLTSANEQIVGAPGFECALSAITLTTCKTRLSFVPVLCYSINGNSVQREIIAK